MKSLRPLVLLAAYAQLVSGFVPTKTYANLWKIQAAISTSTTTGLRSRDRNNDDDNLERTFGGYTVKQRLREEAESPFRTARLYFFGVSTIGAIVAFYFSLLTLGKAYAGVYSDSPPVDEAVANVGINILAILVCGGITFRDYQAGQANLARIKQGGALASLVVERADSSRQRVTLADFRRNARVLIAAGGKEYIEKLCLNLNAPDQLGDENTLPQAIAAADLIVVPVLLDESSELSTRVGDTITCWKETTTQSHQHGDGNLDVTGANAVIAFPRGPAAWADVLQQEVKTATGQGFNVAQKGITLLLKKNGKILRRATGQPQWSGILGAMDMFDKNFGMPGDDTLYGSGNAPSA